MPMAASKIKLTPRTTDEQAEASPLGRFSIEKQFRGDLEATGKGEMLSAGTQVKGSAGYVAIKRITGTLGRTSRHLHFAA